MTAKYFAFRGADAWRRHPIFSWGWKEAMPGLREGVGLFAVWYVYDAVSHRKSGGHAGGHEAGHGDGHHDSHGAAGGAAPAAHHH